MPLRTSSRGVSLLALPLILVALVIGGLSAPAVAAASVESIEAPWIAGGAKSTNTLSALPGTWSPDSGVTFAYQWLVDGSPIAGATGPHYTIGLLSTGGRYAVTVTATAPGLPPGTATSMATGPAVGLLSNPAFENRGRPLITGTPQVGVTLTASNGQWSVAPGGIAYQWTANGANIAGATQKTFVPDQAQLGKVLAVKVTAQSGSASATGTSAATTAVTGGAINNVSAPALTVSGTPKVGEIVSASPGTWSVSGTSYAYQWSADATAITGATASSFTPTDAQVGKRLSVKVTATRSGFTQGVAQSDSTAPVEAAAAPGIRVTNGPTLVGQPRIGKVLQARAGTFTPSGVHVSYQWLRAGSPIAGATASKFALTRADLGNTLTVQATYARADLSSVVRTSSPTSTVKSTPQFTVQHSEKRGAVKLTIVVKAPAVSTVSGDIQVTENGHKLVERALNRGRVAVTLRGLSRGKHAFRISLSGGGDVADGSATTSFRVG